MFHRSEEEEESSTVDLHIEDLFRPTRRILRLTLILTPVVQRGMAHLQPEMILTEHESREPGIVSSGVGKKDSKPVGGKEDLIVLPPDDRRKRGGVEETDE